MASSEFVLLDMGDLHAPKGSVRWVRAVHEEAKAALTDAMQSREAVDLWVKALLEGDNFRKLAKKDGSSFLLWEDFCATPQPFGLGYNPDAIEAIKASRPSAKEQAVTAVPMAEHRRPTNEERENKCSHRTFSRGEGDTEYLTARIARDRPDILARMKAGEFKSVRAAAREAGFVKERVSVPKAPAGAAAAIKRHFSESEVREIVELLK